MSAKSVKRLFLPLCLALGAAACNQQTGNTDAAASEVRQTKFPGQVTAGGQTGGQLMSRNGELPEKGDSEGTPGIPQGKGGNTGGAAMSGEAQGTSPVAGAKDGPDEATDEAATGHPQENEEGESGPAQESQQVAAGKPAPDDPKRAAEAKAAREKRELEVAMDTVAQHWRMRAARNDWPDGSTSAGQDAAEAAAQQEGMEPPLIRSEKLGTAPPSEDVKPAPSPGSEAGTPAF